VLSSTVQKERAVVRWELSGTFAGAAFGGVAPTGARIHLEGMDELTIRDGLIQQNNAYSDAMTFARQIGMLPARGLQGRSAHPQGVQREEPAGGAPGEHGRRDRRRRGLARARRLPKRSMNVYLVRDDGGVLAFDAGIRQMTRGIAAAAAQLGGLTRVVLGTRTPTTAARRRRSARPCSATPTTARTPRVTAAATTSTSASCRRTGASSTPSCSRTGTAGR
jgi:hypothetical protein